MEKSLEELENVATEDVLNDIDKLIERAKTLEEINKVRQTLFDVLEDSWGEFIKPKESDALWRKIDEKDVALMKDKAGYGHEKEIVRFRSEFIKLGTLWSFNEELLNAKSVEELQRILLENASGWSEDGEAVDEPTLFECAKGWSRILEIYAKCFNSY